MKNPRKSPNNPADTVGRGLKTIQQDLLDLPRFNEPEPLSQPLEISSPEEASFRALLHQKLSRHKAPEALRERILNSIKNMPD